MFIAANFIRAVGDVVNIVLTFYMWVIIIRALVSWASPDPYNPIVQFLYKVTEPVLNPLRRLIPMYNIGIDFSPLIAIMIIIFMKAFLVASLYQLAGRMQ